MPIESTNPEFTAVAAVILAAGKSTRMRSRLPKPLHQICGLPLTGHVICACRAAGVDRVVIVVGHEEETVRKGLGNEVEYAVQAEQRGSGHAAQAAKTALQGFHGPVLVLAGDVPLLTPDTLQKLIDHHRATGAAATLVTALLDDPTGYGRILRDSTGEVERIVEQRDASPEERAIREVNPFIYCFQSDALFEALDQLKPDNSQGELYLTDVIGILKEGGLRIQAISTDDATEVFGINSRVELSAAGRMLRHRILRDLMLGGVTITDPDSTYVDVGVTVGQDSVIEPQSFLLGQTTIGEECTIGPMTRVQSCVVGNRTSILASQVVRSEIGSNVRIGPFANLRPGCRLADGVKIGDFVELKNATLEEKVSASHLSYIGDADVGAGANIGAGVVTCNYDGEKKHRTTIGRDAFIGTHTTLIAPVKVGEGAYIAAGSPINVDVPDGALAIARSRPEIKPGWAARRADRKRAEQLKIEVAAKPSSAVIP